MVDTQAARLLIVEDDIHLLQGIRDILEIEGYEVFTASSGKEGLDVLNNLSIPPDLIISDIMMPRMDGYQFLEAVRASQAWLSIPFVFLTAKGEKHDVRQGKRLGADDYVVKPMDPEDLLVIVAAKLKRHQELATTYEDQVVDIKRKILTILNHEFRTPLTYMVAYSDMLSTDAESLTSEELRTFLHGVNSGADRFRRLVENFIALVELETGEAVQNYTWRHQPITNLQPLATEVVNMCSTLAEEQGVSVEIDLPERVPEFMGDYDYLRAALLQLLDNAIKFSDKPGSKVLLRASADEDHVSLSVQDEGRGIEPHFLAGIWEPFTQINRDQYEDQGAGSGLSIVKGIVNLHNGTVQVESTFGQGSTFTISLPRTGR